LTLPIAECHHVDNTQEMKARITLAFVVVTVIATLFAAQSKRLANSTVLAVSQHQSSQTVVRPETTTWGPSGVGEGYVVLSGSPDTEGSPFVIRLKFGDGTRIPPHWHPVDEHVTVIEGTFYMGMGGKFDESKAEEMPAGSYGLMPKEHRHFGWTRGETIIQIHGVGPFKTYWVESPEKRGKKGNQSKPNQSKVSA
jgi:quercetin dioxygenase-like cupin family protein